MEHWIALIISMLELGCIYSLVVLGVYVTSRIISTDDFTIEGSFATGGALTALLLLKQLNPIFCCIGAVIIGGIVGMATGLLHTKLKLNNLISGIVVATGLFSVNLKLAGPHAIVPSASTIFAFLGLYEYHLVFLGLLSILALVLVHWFLKTEYGFCLRSVGDNPHMLIHLGKDPDRYKIVGLMIANSLSALAGCLMVMHTEFYSLMGSFGTLIIALAGLIIGRAISKHMMIGVLCGAVAYQAIIVTTIELQVDPAWNKLITAGLIIALIAFQKRGSSK